MGHLNQNTRHVKMQNVCMALLTKGVQNVNHLHGHMPGDAFSTGQLQNAVSIMSPGMCPCK